MMGPSSTLSADGSTQEKGNADEGAGRSSHGKHGSFFPVRWTTLGFSACLLLHYRSSNRVPVFFTGTAGDAHEKERDIDEGAAKGGHGKQAFNTPNASHYGNVQRSTLPNVQTTLALCSS